MSWRLALGAVVALAGCDDKPRPWSGKEGQPAVLQPVPGAAAGASGASGGSGADDSSADAPAEPPQTAAADASSSPPAPGDVASAPTASDDAASASSAPVEATPGGGAKVTPGGGWVRCHEGFSLSGDPVKDVTRLGLLCGPSNGMRRRSRQAIVGVVGEHEPPVTASIPAARGACYRVFAAADAQVGELDVTVRSSRGVGVAADHGKGRLAIVQPDRPFCTFSDETFTIEVSAARGGGRFAAEVWALGEPRKRHDPAESPADEAPLDEPD